MFALDAERGQLFLGVNGQWHNGVPGEQGGETIGSPRSNFTPYATMSASSSKTTPEGDRWIANFGGSKFKYPIPGGFAAYGSSAAAQTTSSSASPPQQVALASAQGSSSTLNRVFQDEISIGGQRIPLPEGKWTGLAFFRGGSGVQGDSTLLGRVVDGRLSGVVAINAYVTSGRGDGFPAFAACDRTDYLYANPTSNRAFGQQRCWWINHASQVDTQPIFRAAASVLDQRGVALPATLINVGFRRATTDGFATVFYYFNPEEAGLASQRTTWGASEWHKGMISEDPRRMAYVERLRKWGESWAPVFFAMGRQQ